MSPITTHVLDTSRGRPAEGISVTLSLEKNGAHTAIGKGVTDADGRVRTLLADGHVLAAGQYSLRFDVRPYFTAHGTPSFYPYVTIAFEVVMPSEHYHVPLLLNPFGYSTYRGS